MDIRRNLLAGLAFTAMIPVAGEVLASEGYRYGYQLMTAEELAEHRQVMRSFDTDEAREAYRRQHHEAMRARAAEQGVTLPAEPLPRGQGYGRGRGGRWND